MPVLLDVLLPSVVVVALAWWWQSNSMMDRKESL